ncbi:hypothetical protein F5Y12DRAFT_151298 [Xylaria sp. FL1777]|nr:hypothetical protein F5Y12DRAFT_151298 [Xylaria sp. FL1777]
MHASVLFFSLSAIAAVVSASAIPKHEHQYGLAKRQNTATIPTFNFGPSSTVSLGGGGASNVTSRTQRASATEITSPAATSSSVTTSSAAGRKASSTTTAVDTGSATGTIPIYSFFPSSTIQVSPGATSQPAAGNGTANQGGNQAGGNTAGNGTADGSGNNGQTGGQSNLQDLVDLLQGLLNLLGK